MGYGCVERELQLGLATSLTPKGLSRRNVGLKTDQAQLGP